MLRKAHAHRIQEKHHAMKKVQGMIYKKEEENRDLDAQVSALDASFNVQQLLHQTTSKPAQERNAKGTLKDIFTRRRLLDLAKSQAQDIAILRDEVQRLRLRTYPAFAS